MLILLNADNLLWTIETSQSFLWCQSGYRVDEGNLVSACGFQFFYFFFSQRIHLHVHQVVCTRASDSGVYDGEAHEIQFMDRQIIFNTML